MIFANNLSKRFGHLQAVDDISLNLSRGEVLGFLGPNGSGKSTTMKMITGFMRPDKGQIEICGINMLTQPIAAQRHIGYLPEGAPAYDDLTTFAYLSFIAEIRQFFGASKHRAISYVVERTNIGAVLHQPIGTLSKGFKRRVGLAQALLHNPDVLILDEPTDGLDPNQKHEVRNLIREISPDKAIIISTHILEEVETLCDRTLIIANGHVVSNGTPREFEQRSRYYNAVTLILAPSDTDAVHKQLLSIEGVSDVEITATADSSTLIALADPDQNILSSIATRAQQQSWPIVQLHLKKVNLDEIFRDVTTNTHAQRIKTSVTAAEILPSISSSSQLRDLWSLCKNELNCYFSTPVAYVFIVIFLLSMGAFTFFLGGFFTQGQASLDVFFQFHPWLYLFLIPALAMRLWSEERKSGSIEVLLTLPVTRFSAVMGKFIAAWLVIGLSLLLTTTIWLTVNYLGSPDNGAIAAGYLGSFFMAGGYLAISTFVSAITKNQVIAFIVAAALCFVFTASGLGLVLEFFSAWASPLVLSSVANFSFLEHFRDISRGVIDLGDIAFFLSTMVFFLFANIVAVDRWQD